MYKKIKEIPSTRLFLVNTSYLVHWERNKSKAKISYFSKNKFELVKCERVENGRIIKKKDNEYTWVVTTSPLIINEYSIDKEKKIQSVNRVFQDFNPYIHNSSVVIGTTRDDDMNINGIHCIDNSGNTIWTIKEASVVFFNKDNHLLYYNLDENKITQITNVNLLTGEIIWKKPTIDFYGRVKSKEDKSIQLSKFLGCVDDKLYMTFIDYSVIEVDIETGLKTNSWIFEVGDIQSLHPLNTFLLEDEMKIVGIRETSFWGIDLKSSKMNVTDLSETFSSENISATSRGICAFSGEHIIFPSEKIIEEPNFKYDYINQVVALNLNTLKVEWIHRFEDLQGMNFCSKIETDENHVYVLDVMQRLHIFEKTKSNQ